MSAVLYITYDGLLDPLGGSQILPYLIGISESQDGVIVLSFEKNERQEKNAVAMAENLERYNIQWKPLSFTANKGVLGKAWDLLKMYLWGVCLAIQHRVRVVHARGHPSATTALLIKRLTGAQMIFDFRGLWVDERVDKGGWDLERRSHRLQYSYFKKTERTLLAKADKLVVLSEAVVPEVRRLSAIPSTKVTVIPCCADFEHFPLVVKKRRSQARDDLNIPRDALVLGYLGSIGRVYMLNQIFRLFELGAKVRGNIHLLVVTQDTSSLSQLVNKHVPISLRERVHVYSATREQVPNVIAAMDVTVSFYRPSYSRMAVSPTKLAESFASGIPVICNAGVGDVEAQVNCLKAGLIVDPSSDKELLAAVANLDEILAMGGERLRIAAKKDLCLEVAARRYCSVYENLRS